MELFEVSRLHLNLFNSTIQTFHLYELKLYFSIWVTEFWCFNLPRLFSICLSLLFSYTYLQCCFCFVVPLIPQNSFWNPLRSDSIIYSMKPSMFLSSKWFFSGIHKGLLNVNLKDDSVALTISCFIYGFVFIGIHVCVL